MIKKPTKFYFKESDNSRRGYNILISVYYIDKDGQPRFVGSSDEQSAGWKGGRAVANNIISEEYGYKMRDGYSLQRQDIKVFEI